MIDQLSFIMLLFESRPEEEIDSYDVEEQIRQGWRIITGDRFRDPGRRLRQLREGGYITAQTRSGVLYYRFSRPYRGD